MRNRLRNRQRDTGFLCHLTRILVCAAIAHVELHAFAYSQQTIQARPPETQPSSITLPVSYQRQVLIVTLTDPKIGLLHMLLDSGAETTILNGAAATRGNIDRNARPFDAAQGSGSEQSLVQGAIHVDLHAASTPVFSTTAAVLDLRRVSRAMPQPIDGLLGWDFFQHWCIRLDYSHQQITLTPPNTCKAPAGKHATLVGEWLMEGFLLPAHLTFNPTQSADALLHLDTGADPAIALSNRFLKFATIKDPPQPGHGIGGDFTNDYTELSSADLDHGSLVFHGAPIPTFIARKGGFSNGHWWNTGRAEARLNRDGVVGNGLLQSLTLTFDPIHRRIYTEVALPPSQPSFDTRP